MALKIDGLINIKKIIQETQGKAFTKGGLNKMGARVVATMKNNISKGISPIEGNGRFPGYKDVSKYPSKVQKRFPDKKARPVNLKLTGEFLDSLGHESKAGKNAAIIIGYPPDQALKEEGHRDGANGQLKRPTIPNANESFSVKIMNDLIDDLKEAVNKYFKQTKLTK